jgi:hypothetical protein
MPDYIVPDGSSSRYKQELMPAVSTFQAARTRTHRHMTYAGRMDSHMKLQNSCIIRSTHARIHIGLASYLLDALT